MQPANGQKTILIVEDSSDLQLLLGQFLNGQGYNVIAASNGQEALAILRSASRLPDLIFLDIMMPVMDGHVFRKEQAKDSKISSIPVVVMTAHAQEQAHLNSLAANGYLRKPFSIHSLLEMAQKHCV